MAVLRYLTRFLFILALAFFASGEASALMHIRAPQNDLAGPKTASGIFSETIAMLRHAAASQAVELQQGKTSRSYDFAPASPLAAEKTAARNLAPRALTQADLGIKGTLQELRGTFSVTDGVATARIDMIQGKIANPFQIIENLSATARAGGASTLRIEATIANERLYNILVNRYGMTSQGAIDVITIPLK